MHLSSQNHPPTLVHGKIVFYETSPWCQKDWELLLLTARGITPKWVMTILHISKLEGNNHGLVRIFIVNDTGENVMSF